MADPAYLAETLYLHSLVEATGGDVFFSADVEEAMRAAGITRTEILFFLKFAEVVHSEREEMGWQWELEGEGCDGETMIGTVLVDSNVLRIEVLKIDRS